MTYTIVPIIGTLRIVFEGGASTFPVPSFSALEIPEDVFLQCKKVDLRESIHYQEEIQERIQLSEKLCSNKKLSQKDRHKISYYLTGIASGPERSQGGQIRHEDDRMLADDFQERVSELVQNKSMPEKEAKKMVIERFCRSEAKMRGAKEEILDESTIVKAIGRGKKPHPNEPPF
jgi:hypothetical protein